VQESKDLLLGNPLFPGQTSDSTHKVMARAICPSAFGSKNEDGIPTKLKDRKATSPKEGAKPALVSFPTRQSGQVIGTARHQC